MKFKFFIPVAFFSLVLLSACGQQTTTQVAPSSTPRAFAIPTAELPNVGLTPRTDGHQVTLSMVKLPSYLTKVDYEFIYTAIDNGNEIEKGTSGTLDLKTKTQDDILLGTASCTAGCKYSYDAGVTGGEVNLTLTNSSNQVATENLTWKILSATDVKKAGNSLIWKEENFSYKISGKSSEFYIVVKNPESYSVYSVSGLVKDVPLSSSTQ